MPLHSHTRMIASLSRILSALSARRYPYVSPFPAEGISEQKCIVDCKWTAIVQTNNTQRAPERANHRRNRVQRQEKQRRHSVSVEIVLITSYFKCHQYRFKLSVGSKIASSFFSRCSFWLRNEPVLFRVLFCRKLIVVNFICKWKGSVWFSFVPCFLSGSVLQINFAGECKMFCWVILFLSPSFIRSFFLWII